MISIKRWDNGEVIHSGDFKSVKECLEDGVSKGVSFYRADLIGSNLRDSNLSCSNLSYSSLIGSNLSYSNLSGSNLIGSNLRDSNLSCSNLSYSSLIGSNLSFSNLSGSNLIGSDLRGAIGNGTEVKSLQVSPHKLTYYNGELWGGCTHKTCEDWLAYEGEGLDESDKEYLEKITKPFIRMCEGV